MNDPARNKLTDTGRKKIRNQERAERMDRRQRDAKFASQPNGWMSDLITVVEIAIVMTVV